MNRAGMETEVKLPILDVGRIRRRLRQLGLRVRVPRSLEENLLFDSPHGALRRRRSMLRLRSTNGQHYLTFKGPAAASKRYKIRAEVETEVVRADAVGAILGELGFRPIFRYEKYRTVFAAAGRRTPGEVMLDETPIGDFVELEGSRRWIREMARQLGADPGQFITKDYARLYRDWCRQHGRQVSNMVFALRKRSSSLTKGRRKRI